MKNPTKGQKVKVIGNSNRHHYDIGTTYTVSTVDTNDNTCRLADNSGNTRDWCAFDDIEPSVAIGWAWLQQNLAPDVVDLLSLFDGIEHLTLKTEMSSAILQTIPDLKKSLLDYIERKANPTEAPAPAPAAPTTENPFARRLRNRHKPTPN